MEDKDVEKILKDSAEKIEIKSFSERWNNISERLNSPQDNSTIVQEADAILVNSVNVTKSDNSTRKKIICVVGAFFLIIVLCLAIVLPIVLKKESIPKYLDLIDLNNVNASESEFYSEMENSDLEIVDLSKFEISSFGLLYTSESDVVGGRFELLDMYEYVYSTIVFYNTTVISTFDIGTDYKTYEINGYNIEYKTEQTEDYYSSKIKASNSSITYELNCLSVEEDLENFFVRMFG